MSVKNMSVCHSHKVELLPLVLTYHFFTGACGYSFVHSEITEVLLYPTTLFLDVKDGFGVSWVFLTKTALAGVHRPLRKPSHCSCGKRFSRSEKDHLLSIALKLLIFVFLNYTVL